MTNRELFHATMSHENGDQLLHFELGFNVPYKTWYKEGMPRSVVPCSWAELTPEENLYDHFNVTGMMFPKFADQFMIPPMEKKVLKDDGSTIIFLDERGNKLMGVSDNEVYRDDGSTIGSPPTELDFAIKTPEDYMALRDRYTGHIKERVDFEWLKKYGKAFQEQPDFITHFWSHGPFSFLRELLGTENAMILPYEEPDMIRMMLKDHLEVCKEVSVPIIEACRPDCSFLWEDCCGSNGPFIAPSIFDELFAPWYREWKDYCTSMGVKWVILDTDGDPSPLVTRWYGNGIDCMHPWEVNGVDMLRCAEEHPEYVMTGGIYKHMFEPCSLSQVGRFNTTDVHEAIDQELERVVAPMRKRGGYTPSLDHWAFWGVHYNDYRYYSERLYDYGKANQSLRDRSKAPV